MSNRHTISILVENHSGVLARIASLFASRGYNIDSLTVGETEDLSISRMTVVARGDTRIIEQITKQLNKLIDVIKVVDLSQEGFTDRELILMRVDASRKNRAEVVEVAKIFSAKAVNISASSITFELSGETDHVESFIDIMRPFGIKELVRTGNIAMAKSK